MAETPKIKELMLAMQRCSRAKILANAKALHLQVCNHGLEAHQAVGNCTVAMLTDCGSVYDAHQAFNKLVHPNERSWTALILGYTEFGLSQYALTLYQHMQEANIYPSTYTLMAIAKACAKLKDPERGRLVHLEIAEKGFDRDLFVGTTLVDMYAKCGLLLDARKVFDKLPVRSVVSWTALITGYAEHGPSQKALDCYEEMQLEGASPNAITFASVLKVCASVGDINKGRELHREIMKRGLETHLVAANTLVDMYVKCGSFSEALEVFDSLPVRTVVSWTALISGYTDHGNNREALRLFEQMKLESIPPNAVTFLSLLKACANMGDLEKGQEIHEEIIENELDRESFISNTLIYMYSKCGAFPEARSVLDKMLVRDVVSWNALVAGYTENGNGTEVLNFLEEMQLEGIPPNAVTFICILKACSNIKAADRGREIHKEIRKRGFDRDLFVGSTLIDMYAKCGSVSEAQEVFDQLIVRNVVSWNALISGYAEHGYGQEALECFDQMQQDGVSPDAVTFFFVSKACGNLGALDKGREIHSDIIQRGLERDCLASNSLIDMYVKCGSLSEANDVFGKLQVQTVVSWSAMIYGYGMNHEGQMAVQCFRDMQEQGMKPDAITFTCLLTACSRNNMVSKGHEYFKLMGVEYGIIPTNDHYVCMLDIFARSGHLYEAEKFLKAMPYPQSFEAWTSLLNACKAYGEAELGIRCFQQLVELNEEYPSPYVLMTNIFAHAGRKEDAHRIEELRKLSGAKKKPAKALIEVNKKVHEFTVGNTQSEEIAALLEHLSSYMEEEGHVPHLDLTLRSLSDEEKEAVLCEHAEKLAVAFGLLNMPQGQTLRVTKSLRMCNNCHTANKIISTIERREIVVRDSYCVHHFRDGFCSCGELF